MTNEERSGPSRKKIPTQLVERPRVEKWWSEMDCYTPSHFEPPAILGEKISVLNEDTLYCLDSQFNFAKAYKEYRISDSIGYSSTPVWSGKDHIAISMLLCDGRYQAMILNLQSGKMTQKTMHKGKEYKPFTLFEDGYPLSPINNNGHLIFISPYGNYYIHDTAKSGLLYRNKNLRVRKQPCLDSFGQIIVPISDSDNEWLEWRDSSNMKRIHKSKQYNNNWGLILGFAGTAPTIISNGNIVCGFGEILACFNSKGEAIWEYHYPRLDARDPTGGMRVYSVEGSARQLIFETTSEVTINSNIVEYGAHIFFVLAEGTRHTSYVTKMTRDSGEVVWTSCIDGFSGPFCIHNVSESELFLQNDKYFWLISEGGKKRNDFILDLDCTDCSSAVRISGNKFAVNSDFGIHVFEFCQPKEDTQPSIIISHNTEPRHVFLSHASEDKFAIVEPFYEACKRKGISAWYDAAEIRWGDSLVKKIEEGLATSKIVLLFISKDSLKKKWPENELTAALSQEICNNKLVLPLVLGLSGKELTNKHPLLAQKLYRRVERYNQSKLVDNEIIESIVSELFELLVDLKLY